MSRRAGARAEARASVSGLKLGLETPAALAAATRCIFVGPADDHNARPLLMVCGDPQHTVDTCWQW